MSLQASVNTEHEIRERGELLRKCARAHSFIFTRLIPPPLSLRNDAVGTLRDFSNRSRFPLYRHTCFEVVLSTICRSCAAATHSIATMQILSVPFPERPLPGTRVEQLTLVGLLQHYTFPSPVAWKCRCLSPNASQTSSIYSPTETLILQLMRFSMVRGPKPTIIKEDRAVIYSQELDLRPILSLLAPKPAAFVYDLSGVILHRGGYDYGHYRAFSRNKGTWFLYDDDSVEPADIKDVLGMQGEVYMLMYNLRLEEADV